MLRDTPLPETKQEFAWSTGGQADAIRQLAELIAYRNCRLADIEARFASDLRAREAEFAAKLATARDAHQSVDDQLNQEYITRLEEARKQFDAAQDQLTRQRDQQVAQAKKRFEESLATHERSWRETRLISQQNHEADLKLAAESHQQAKSAAESCRQQCEWLTTEATSMLRRRGRRWRSPTIPPTDPDVTGAALMEGYSQAATRVHANLKSLAALPQLRFVDEGWPILLFFAVLIGLGGYLGYISEWQGWSWPTTSLGAAILAAGSARFLAETWGRRIARPLLEHVQQELTTASICSTHAQEVVETEDRRRQRQLTRKKDQHLRQADEAWQQISADLREEFQRASESCGQEYSQRLQAEERTWNEQANTFRANYPPRIKLEQERFAQESAALERDRDAELKARHEEREREWRELREQWHAGADAFADFAAAQREFVANHFPPLPEFDVQGWEPVPGEIRGVPLGEFTLRLTDFPEGPPTDPRLQLTWSTQTFPAWLAYPDSPSLLLKAELEGRAQAIGVLQQAMLRMITAFPPGSIQFTLFDPTGLGQNFSAFMHLGDYDERFVGARIWTETNHIQQRLLDLTEHMENVIQKYLRNDFRSIQEYNLHAGEIAEPFQVLVMANFPANISEEAARRLASIATSGARCGVYFLISVDTRLGLPRDFDLRDLEAHANTLVWEEGRFVWQDSALRRFPLSLTPPPNGDVANRIIRAAGERARNAIRVEVPFQAVTPPSGNWWQADSRHELSVPLGRAGAMQMQALVLGKGTSQHVLIAGKTGSGKSTLLNAMITNLALLYSPNEVRFLLVDFKKGVEFKAYAQHRLPHAEVIAIESEREFGMSVLQRLDQELHTRGEAFRTAGVQGLAAFREARPREPMPRLLLIVDEFQEFFVKDDKIAQEASLLLDRLVRQGRAFGIHVVLGSQTLAGAYTLARSTLGQMAVRIALQCSEADAHLILSEDNTAARLLRRPGEAIYNHANGLLEGNHLFQVVWLPDAEREDYLKRLAAFAAERPEHSAKTIVFEGNTGADIRENEPLIQQIQRAPDSTAIQPATIFLGAPVAIKPPTQLTLRRQSGHHLLLVGQDEELAAAVLGSALVSLSAAQPVAKERPGVRQAKCMLLDGGAEGLVAGVASELGKLPFLDLTSVDPPGVTYALETVALEVRRRLEAAELQAPPIYVAIYHLARYRDLRKGEEDYGLGSFSSGGATSDINMSVPASRRLAEILRDGPVVGVHLLIWCDTYNNLSRWFERQALREISYRVLFQMTPTDSSNLMDSAIASQLGPHRAVLYDDDRGEMERFRPYGWPALARVLREDDACDI